MSDGETVRGKLPPVQIAPGTKKRYLEHLAVKPEDLEHWHIQNETGAVVGLAQRDGAMAGGTISGVIYDDEAAAVPEEPPAGYDLETCSEKHSRMTAYQAQRIDQLEARIAKLEQTIRDWSAD